MKIKKEVTLKQHVLSALHFVRLVDADRKMSLTNIAVMVVIAKLALSANATAPVDVGALVTTLLSYQASKLIRNKS